MNYLGEDDVTQVMGIGQPGEVRAGLDGRLYQWVEGVDGLGNSIGFWRKLRKRLRKVVRRALPIAQRFAPFIPGAAAALTAVTPVLRQAGVAGYDSLGALYQVPDGSVYQVQGLAEDEELRGLGEDELTQVMGIGQPGEVRTAPNGGLYEWVEGVDGLGNSIGFWRKLRRGLRKVVRRALPIAQRFAPFIPGAAAALTAVTPVLKQAGVAGYDGLGALYQAPDGTMYQVQGLAEDEELRGFAEDEELRGLSEDDELRGFAEDEELRGLAEDEELRGLDEDEELRGLAQDEELRGLAEDEELRGFAEDEELKGFEQGYVREPGASGLDAYVPEQPPATRWFVPPNNPPKMWEPLW